VAVDDDVFARATPPAPRATTTAALAAIRDLLCRRSSIKEALLCRGI
jgi:hypothetical protein